MMLLPCVYSTFVCWLVVYPLCCANWYTGIILSMDFIRVSRVTFATIDAAATEHERDSASINACTGRVAYAGVSSVSGIASTIIPLMETEAVELSWQNARLIARSVAW